MSRPRTSVVCMVTWPDDPTIGIVYREDGKMWVEWPDGADVVWRAADGSLWDEYGDDLLPHDLRNTTGQFTGTRLEVYG